MTGFRRYAWRVFSRRHFLAPACVLLYGVFSASAGPHYGARCWCTIMPQCVQQRREIYGRGCLLPTPSWTQRVLQVPYQTRLRVAPDWLLTEQAHGGARQV